MKNESVIKIFLLIILPVLEIVLRNSQIPFLMQFKIVYLIGIFLVLIKSPKISLVFVLVASFAVELFSLNTIGISALAFFLAEFVVNIVFSFISMNKEIGKKVMGAVVLLASIFFELILINFIAQKNLNISFSILIFNLLVYLIVLVIADKFNSSSNVFKK